MDAIEETIREIAAKHGIAVGRDDPIMILHTINERLAQNSAAAQRENLARFAEELEGMAHRWGEDARTKAERSLNAALSASKDTMARGAEEAARAASDAIREELAAGIGRLDTHLRAVRVVGWLNVGASVATLGAAAVLLLLFGAA